MKMHNAFGFTKFMEQRQKMSTENREKMKGNKRGSANAGRILSEETKNKISISMRSRNLNVQQ